MSEMSFRAWCRTIHSSITVTVDFYARIDIGMLANRGRRCGAVRGGYVVRLRKTVGMTPHPFRCTLGGDYF